MVEVTTVSDFFEDRDVTMNHHDIPQDSKVVGLFGLPQELRDQIYEEAVFPDRSQTAATEKASRTSGLFNRFYSCTDRDLPQVGAYTGCAGWAPPALARVSRRLRAEVLALFYKKARFIFNFRIPQTLDALRNGLVYLYQSQPDRVLQNFWFNWRALDVGWIEPLVGIAQVFGTFRDQILKGAMNFGCGHDTNDFREQLPKSCELLQDVIDLGRNMDRQRLKDRVSVREDLTKMLCDKNVDEAKRAFRESIWKGFQEPVRPRPARE